MMKKKSKAPKILLGIVAFLVLGFVWLMNTDFEEEGAVNNGLTEGQQTELAQLMRSRTGLELPQHTSQLDENPLRSIKRSTVPIRQTVGTAFDGSDLPSDFYPFRATLSAKEQKVYDLLRQKIQQGVPSIEMTVPCEKERVWDIHEMVVYENPEFFWAENDCVTYSNEAGMVTKIEPGYNELVEDIPGNTARVEAAVRPALASMAMMDSDIEKVKFAHDYLAHTITYNLDAPHNQNIYSGLVNKETVCAGYAYAFQYLLHRMKIPCSYVIGDVSGGGPHAWNLLRLDGEYYAMDVTWNDEDEEWREVSYDYFNVIDEGLNQVVYRSRDAMFQLLPEANGTRYSFDKVFSLPADMGSDFSLMESGQVAGFVSPVGGPAESTQEEGQEEPAAGESSVVMPAAIADFGWWNRINPSLSVSDWSNSQPGWWQRWNEADSFWYFYHERDASYYTVSQDHQHIFILDKNQWVPLDQGTEKVLALLNGGGSSGGATHSVVPAEDEDAQQGQELGHEDNGWWNFLDKGWTQADWSAAGQGQWEIWDEESLCWYMYSEETEVFRALAEETQQLYCLVDGQWVVDANLSDVGYDSYDKFGYDWWNILDDTWTRDDWEMDSSQDRTWKIWDEETGCWYLYNQDAGEFYCQDEIEDILYWLDFDTGEWVALY